MDNGCDAALLMKQHLCRMKQRKKFNIEQDGIIG